MDLDRFGWRTSTFGGENGNRCVEVTPTPALDWRTSSFSADSGGSCVEVAPTPTGVAIRDTKDRTRAPHLHSATAWRAFVAAVRDGEFDH